ncbi:PQQ-dependent sugar dehydrogenase [Sporosarcina luteola]|uniref:PQQ-dependent sugar dehydrogenase n=1 Tax=Bacillales TaxID=1385 RepID=UPI002041E831|nr:MULTISPECIES: PQQ-dependent sugar dehydrogenase [Bacillales]MCM3636151.1 PQQ-dependent sugar dehydrogenase [Sporosarcina luteola]
MKKLLLFIMSLAVLAGCSLNGKTAATYIPAKRLATNLEAPWSIASDGERFFISERAGAIVRVEKNGKTIREEVRLSDPLSNAAEAGLLGFVLHDDFVESGLAYAYYTYNSDGAPVNRIVTLKYAGEEWEETEILLDGIESGPVHHGGRLALSPEGVLFATIGDGAAPENAQDPNSFNGKIVKLQDEGSVTIVSLGHRNPQGLAWNAEGELYSSEHGQSANDEINKIVQGGNYGWPEIEGIESKQGMLSPLLTSGTNETWAPSGMTFHNGLLYVAALRGEAILVIDPETMEIAEKIEGYGRIRDIHSDGESLYFISNNTDGRGSPSESDDVLYTFANIKKIADEGRLHLPSSVLIHSSNLKIGMRSSKITTSSSGRSIRNPSLP